MVSLTWYFRWINFLDICLISHGGLINGVKMLAFAEHSLPARCPSGLYVCWLIRFLQPCEAGALVIPFYRSREKQWPCPRSQQGSGRTETESHRLQSPVSVNYMFSQVTRFFPSTVPRQRVHKFTGNHPYDPWLLTSWLIPSIPGGLEPVTKGLSPGKEDGEKHQRSLRAI